MKKGEVFDLKNVAQGSFSEVLIDDGFFVLKIQNDNSRIQKVTRHIDSSYIQFHFCLKRQCEVYFQ